MATAQKTSPKKTAAKNTAAKKTAAKKIAAKKTAAKKTAAKSAAASPKKKQTGPDERPSPAASPQRARPAKPPANAREAQTQLAEYALSLPEAYADHPWGELVAKVKKKVFVFLGRSEEDTDVIGFSVKLPVSGEDVLELPFAEPTGYGLGKAGWVTVRFPADQTPPMDELFAWIDESYRAVAPKKLAALLG